MGVPRTTSLWFVRAVLFEVLCKSISHKSLSLIKIENCRGGVCLIQRSYYLLFYLIVETAIKGLLCKIEVLTILAKFLKKSLKQFFSKVTGYGPQSYEKQIPSQVCFQNFAKILETFCDIARTPIQQNCS